MESGWSGRAGGQQTSRAASKSRTMDPARLPNIGRNRPPLSQSLPSNGAPRQQLDVGLMSQADMARSAAEKTLNTPIPGGRKKKRRGKKKKKASAANSGFLKKLQASPLQRSANPRK